MFLNARKKEDEEKRKVWSLKKKLSFFGITIIGVIAIVLLVLNLMKKPENSKRESVNILLICVDGFLEYIMKSVIFATRISWQQMGS